MKPTLTAKIDFRICTHKNLWIKLKRENKCPVGWRATRYQWKVVFTCKDVAFLGNMTQEALDNIEALLNLMKEHS